MRGRDGFTLIEVMVAMVILGIVLLGVQAAMTDRLIRDMGGQDKRATALQLATERIHAVQLDPVYGSLEARYATTESPVPGFTGFDRVTRIRHTYDDDTGLDYKTVTVSVTAPGLASPVERTVVVGAP